MHKITVTLVMALLPAIAAAPDLCRYDLEYRDGYIVAVVPSFTVPIVQALTVGPDEHKFPPGIQETWNDKQTGILMGKDQSGTVWNLQTGEVQK